MELGFITVLASIATLCAMAIPGVIIRKIKLIDGGAVKALVAVLLFVNQPMLVVKSFQSYDYEGGLLYLCLAFIGGLATHLTMFGASRLIFPLKSDKNRIHTFSVMFANSSYLGIPLIAALFPSYPQAICYMAAYGISFNMLTWTLGVYIMTGKKENISAKRAFINPPTLALLAALPLFFTNTSIQPQLLKCVTYLGDMATPLSMIIIGAKFAELPIKELFTDYKTYIVCALKLVAAPLVASAVLTPFSNDANEVLIKVLVVASGMPTAFAAVLFSERAGADSQTAVKNVAVSTLLAVITIPLLTLVL